MGEFGRAMSEKTVEEGVDTTSCTYRLPVATFQILFKSGPERIHTRYRHGSFRGDLTAPLPGGSADQAIESGWDDAVVFVAGT